MNSLCKFNGVLALAMLLNGCASMHSYLIDRKRDSLDVMTCSIGYGYGTCAQVGAIKLGLFRGYEIKGLRAGEIIEYPPHEAAWFNNVEEYTLYGREDYGFSDLNEDNRKTYLLRRHKLYRSKTLLGISVPVNYYEDQWCRGHLYRLSQIELLIGLKGYIRVGVNPGEVVDLILGFMGIDIYSDDIERLIINDNVTKEENINKLLERVVK